MQEKNVLPACLEKIICGITDEQKKCNASKTVVVGMSGGVDSSVSAYLMKLQGYNVIGLFMHNWEETEGGFCTAEQDYTDVKRVCEKIGIPYYSVNFAKEYYDRVFTEFLQEYKAGRTPNPDVLCNREIKFGPFLEYALAMGADFIATGHYAKVENQNGVFYLKKCKDASKDQTYFLNQLNQYQLSKVFFPLADLLKTEVREIARYAGLINAEKKDSTGICFIGERNFKNFLQGYLPAKEGIIMSLDGKILGKHSGVMFYTLGQRKGLNIGGYAGGNGKPWYVVDKDVEKNILYVNQGEEGDVLCSISCITEKFHFIFQYDKKQFCAQAKFRYRQEDQQVDVSILEDGKLQIDFKEPQRAVTPGQYAVLYIGDICLGGAKIEFAQNVFKKENK